MRALTFREKGLFCTAAGSVAKSPAVYTGDPVWAGVCTLRSAFRVATREEELLIHGVSQSAVIATRIAQAICDVLPGTDNVVLMNVVADMRRVLDSVTTHNCVMTVPVTFSQHDLVGQSEEQVCKAFRSKLSQGCNREEALHSCFNSAMMNQQIGESKEGLAGAASQIAKRYGLNLPTASVAYTHLTHTGFSEDILGLLDDAYVNYAGLETVGKQALNAICAVTTNRLINLMIIDGTKGELIVRALEKRLTESQISFEDRILERYKGVTFER